MSRLLKLLFSFNNSTPAKHLYNRQQKAFHIHCQGFQSSLGHCLHILPVKLRLFRDLQLIPTVDLRPAGQPGTDVVGAVFVPFRDQIELVPESWAGSHDGHLSGKDVPDLRQLIQAALAQKTSDFCNILIRVLQQMRRHVVGRGHLHGAEFVELEVRLVDAHPLLAEEDRARVIDIDDDREEQEEPGQKDQGESCQHDVQYSLDDFLIDQNELPHSYSIYFIIPHHKMI